MHEQVSITIGAEQIDVDVTLAPIIAGLNERGFPTLFSCQGDLEPVGGCGAAYITFADGLPSEVEEAARNAGFYFQVGAFNDGEPRTKRRTTLRAADGWLWDRCDQGPICETHAYANRAFLRLFQDFIAGDIDTSGHRYTHAWSGKVSFASRELQQQILEGRYDD